ncbi:hypothetical protein Mal15_57010 [Stieleria maiorica]|uniref:Uncharacterized protein n=1 Tax=Stieleria maiorica TaxID=2795974 RepID=A0A5B9MJS7_9BACT|nr:hypothetical protein Mal15_57010 [Stieleria maiorica]
MALPGRRRCESGEGWQNGAGQNDTGQNDAGQYDESHGRCRQPSEPSYLVPWLRLGTRRTCGSGHKGTGLEAEPLEIPVPRRSPGTRRCSYLRQKVDPRGITSFQGSALERAARVAPATKGRDSRRSLWKFPFPGGAWERGDVATFARRWIPGVFHARIERSYPQSGAVQLNTSVTGTCPRSLDRVRFVRPAFACGLRSWKDRRRRCSDRTRPARRAEPIRRRSRRSAGRASRRFLATV